MKTIVAAFLALGLTAFAAAPVPRPSSELKIHEMSGKDTLLSSQKGKVVIVQFLFTSCPHCQNAAVWLTRMQTELGTKGLEIFGVAINTDEIMTPDAKLNAANMGKFTAIAKYPVGVAQTSDMLKYLGMSVMDRGWGVPMFAVIDRKGVIRAQSGPRPVTGDISSEPVMRAMVAKLLAEK
ncbi:MAG: TlpA disulfide reductase family protein [Acidobacteriota bacterium]